MIAAAMAWCALVAALLGLGAVALERALSALGRPTRWVWLGSLALSLAAPALLWLAPVPAAAPASAAPPAAEGGPRAERLLAIPDELVREAGPALPSLDAPLLAAWGAGSAGLLLALGAMGLVLRSRRRTWTAATVDGRPVLVSPETGPAVVGLLRSEIVLPRWALAAPDAVREMMLAHEEEHLRAGDPRLLLAGLAAVVAMPWNPAVWWQLRRLRLAVEMDCDRRVLRRRGDVRAYGTLLLEIGRRGRAGMLAAAAFAEPASFLERRIRAMTSPRVRTSALRAAGYCGLAALAVVAACESPRPGRVNPVASEQVYAAESLTAAARTGADRLALREAVATHFPAVLERGMEGRAALVFVVDAQGQVVRTVATEGGEPAGEVRADGRRLTVRGPVSGIDGIDPATIATVDVSRHPEGRMGPDPVQVIWITLKGEGELSAAPGSGEGARIRIRGTGPMAVASTSPLSAPAGSTSPEAGTPASVMRAAVERHFPEVAAGEALTAPLMFVVDAQGNVVHAVREPDQAAMSDISPESIERVEITKGAALRFGDNPVNVIWVRLKDGAALPR